MAAYAVYSHVGLSPEWRLQEVFDDEREAERYAETLVDTRPAGDDKRGSGRSDRSGGHGDRDHEHTKRRSAADPMYEGGDRTPDPAAAEAIVVYVGSRGDAPRDLPADGVAAEAARFTRPGFGGWPA